MRTNFFELTRCIKKIEYKEVKEAVLAIGGQYEWDLENGDYPIIAVNVGGICPNPTDVCVTKIHVINNGLFVYGVDKEHGNQVDFGVDDIFAGHLAYILDYLPEPKTVNDKIVEEISKWANSSLSHLSSRTEYAKGYREAFYVSQNIVRDILRKYNPQLIKE